MNGVAWSTRGLAPALSPQWQLLSNYLINHDISVTGIAWIAMQLWRHLCLHDVTDCWYVWSSTSLFVRFRRCSCWMLSMSSTAFPKRNQKTWSRDIIVSQRHAHSACYTTISGTIGSCTYSKRFIRVQRKQVLWLLRIAGDKMRQFLTVSRHWLDVFVRLD